MAKTAQNGTTHLSDLSTPSTIPSYSEPSSGNSKRYSLDFITAATSKRISYEQPKRSSYPNFSRRPTSIDKEPLMASINELNKLPSHSSEDFTPTHKSSYSASYRSDSSPKSSPPPTTKATTTATTNNTNSNNSNNSNNIPTPTTSTKESNASPHNINRISTASQLSANPPIRTSTSSVRQSIPTTSGQTSSLNSPHLTTTTTESTLLAGHSGDIIANDNRTEGVGRNNSVPVMSTGMGRVMTGLPRAVIRIERDYTRDNGVTQFTSQYPPELTGKVSQQQFKQTIDQINDLFQKAESLGWSCVDNMIEILTIYTWSLCFSTHYQRSIKRVIRFIEAENRKIYNSIGVNLRNPVNTGFLFLEIELY